MKRTKLLKSIFMALLLSVSSLTATAYDFMVDGIAYNYNSDGTSVSVTSTGTSPNYKDLEHINIPPQVTYGGNTYQVTAIGYYGLCGAFDVKSVTLPEGLISIGECGLNGLSSITELTLPSTLKSVSGWAFEHIDNAEYINCLAVEAPTINGYWFHNNSSLPTCPFYVPKGSLASYQSSSYWNAFNLQEIRILVSDISLDKELMTLEVGQNETLTATIYPSDADNQTVNWTTSDSSVATVDQNGVVSALAVGTATITATTTDGTNLTASCFITVKDLDVATIQVGDGTEKTEVEPFFNWWKRSYVGNEVIYLKEEMEGLNKGDKIVSLAYKCCQGSAKGGNFNFRIKNTTQTSFPLSDDRLNTSIFGVNYNDDIYANVTLGSYSAGDWVTVDLSQPFIYEGENIIIDVRNTAPATAQGWCYFEGTKFNYRRDIAWRNANSENCENDGFHVAYDPYGGEDFGVYLFGDACIIPNVRITFEKSQKGDVNMDGDVNVMDVTAVINHILGNTPEVFNMDAADVNADGNINVVDVTAIINIILNS